MFGRDLLPVSGNDLLNLNAQFLQLKNCFRRILNSEDLVSADMYNKICHHGLSLLRSVLEQIIQRPEYIVIYSRPPNRKTIHDIVRVVDGNASSLDEENAALFREVQKFLKDTVAPKFDIGGS